jgi:hypothetical protein
VFRNAPLDGTAGCGSLSELPLAPLQRKKKPRRVRPGRGSNNPKGDPVDDRTSLIRRNGQSAQGASGRESAA